MTRVLFVDLLPTYLGAQRTLVDFLRRAPAGLEVAVLTAGEPRLEAELRELGVPTIPIAMPSRLASVVRERPPSPAALLATGDYVRQARAAIRRVRPQVCVTNTLKAQVVTAAANPGPAAVGSRLQDCYPDRAHTRGLVRWLLQPRVRSVSCASEAVRRAAIAAGFRPEQAVTIFSAAPRLTAPDRSGPVTTFAIVGQLEPWKGQDLALEAFARVAIRDPRLRLRVVGRPVKQVLYARYLRRRADELGLGDRVSFVEDLTDVEEIYAGVDALIHVPRAHDPLPTVVLEAMALGIPVVASRSGGIPEMVEDGRTGRLVAVGDASGLSRALAATAADPAGARRMADAARRDVQERFGVEEYVRAYAAWIESLAGEGGIVTASGRGAAAAGATVSARAGRAA